MLSETELLQLYQHLNLSKKAQQIISEIRSSPPARRVRSAAGNVSVRYPSRKMGVVIQAESHRNELAGVYEKEYDPATLEYYDQPPRIKLTYQAKNGRRVGVWHTPDYFVIREDSIGWEEWKPESELTHLSEKMPHRYIKKENTWRCPPGEEYAVQFGLFYRIRSATEVNWELQRNLLFLEDYLHEDTERLNEGETQSILLLVANYPGITLKQLLAFNGISSEVVFSMIAHGQIYADLQSAPLAEPQRVSVFRDQQTAQAVALAVSHISVGSSRYIEIAVGTSVNWDDRCWTIINLGATRITLLGERGDSTEIPNPTFENLIKTGRVRNLSEGNIQQSHTIIYDLLAKASPSDFEEANLHYRLILPWLAGTPKTERDIPKRTIRDWIRKWRQAEARYGCGYIGLLYNYRACGNRQHKLPDSTLKIMDEFITNDYETLKQKSKVSVYGVLVKKCEEQGIAIPSYKTFIDEIRKRPRVEQIKKRQGKRAAYQHESFYQELTMTTPRHGDRPFEIGHIDHTLLDIELVCSQTGRNLGRPWGTFLSDAYSRRLLAVTLSFDSPSYRSCMMALRECVQRHGRLPQIIVVDGGREFESVYFETLLARYECSKKTRPGAKPRFGSICERLFGTTNTRFIYNLLGNTQITKNVRQVTKSISPQEQACWTFGQFHVRLCEWAYEIYDILDHPALGQTPREAFDSGLIQGGQRAQRFIPYDENFRMLTLPTTSKGTAKVLPRLGVKINHLCYWSDAFLNPEVEMRQVPIRYDPFNAGVAYAFVQKHWVECISELYAVFAGRSEREIQLTTAELKKRKQLHGQRFTITARKLADFLTSLEAEEVLLEQRLRDFEAKEVLSAKKQPIPVEKTVASQEKSVANSEEAETLDTYEDF